MGKKSSAKKFKISCLMVLILITFCPPHFAQENFVRPSIVPLPLLPEKLMDILINEVSGEIQINNERLLAAFNHNRSAKEYEEVFYESQCMLGKLKEYGIEEAGIEEVPVVLVSEITWDAESAELWMVEPEKKKLSCLEDVPACLCEQSQTCDVTAELVYVGLGTEEKYYEGKNVKGKIVLVNERPYKAHDLAVGKFGAKGLVAYSSSHPEFDPNQVGWDTIARYFDPAKEKDKPLAFGFMISTQMGEALRRMLERGERVVLRAQCKTTYYPTRNEIVWALIRGRERPEEELIFTAHLYEGMAKQGANDNVSGSVSILETARVITKLIQEGKIPRPRRSIRFLWIDEGVGTLGYMQKYPEHVKKWFANINEDMVGEALIKNQSSFHLMTTPYSIPSYLNDVLANFIEYVGETNRDNIINRPVKFVKPILSASGSKDPFYYNIEKFYGASDHVCFLEEGVGIPAIAFITWPDMWYHTNLDRPDKSDSTQLKRVSVIDTAAAIYLADASSKEALHLTGEVLARGAARIADEEKRAYAFLNKSKPERLVENYKEGKNIIHQAYLREEAALKSVHFFAPDDQKLSAYIKESCESLKVRQKISLNALLSHYRNVAACHGVRPISPQLTPEEQRLGRLVPKRTDKMRGYFNSRTFAKSIKDKKVPEYKLGKYEDFEIRNFIDGKRSILEIRNAVSAEFRPVPIKEVENYIRVLEIGGMVIIEKKVT